MRIVTYMIVMAGVTYLIRVMPLALCQRQIQNRFVRSFLFYVPYSVLGAMTFPAVFTSVSQLPSAIAGTLAALFMAYREKNLLCVAAVACAVAFAVDLLMYNAA